MDARRFRPKFIVHGLAEADIRGNQQCLICPMYLMKTVRYYCSGDCMKEAKERDIYGNEEAYLKQKSSG
ncbi:hypothetical protein BCCGELA001_30045 [Bradyrhizobium sp. CCGE-LA001]|nr:hypothetical protein BCCGELA001_30045 [Bradyrhizobium sp. CCGE-LA001]